MLTISSNSNNTAPVATTSSLAASTKVKKSSEKYKKFREQKQREEFLTCLKEFHRHRGTPLNSLPTLNGKPLDLVALYERVSSLGGWEKLCEKDKWDEVASEFGIELSCANGGHALRTIYLRYLSLYEKVHLFGEEPTTTKSMLDDADSEAARKKFFHIGQSVPMSYHHRQHEHIVNSASLLAANEFEKLEMSLTSGLPNETDFVFNCILMLSNDSSEELRIQNSPRLVHLILANIGFFGSDDRYGYRKLYDTWRSHANRNFVKFWHDNTETGCETVRRLLPTLYNKYVTSLPREDLLNVRQEAMGANAEAMRIEQALVVLFNLTFDESNAATLANTPALLEFLIVASFCSFGSEIRHLALDSLANISRKIALNDLSESLIGSLFDTIRYLVTESSDRFEVTHGLEMLAKLCSLGDNDALLSANLDERLCHTICEQLLTVDDLHVITQALECLYQLSHLSEAICNQLLASSKATISVLVSYLTLDAASFFPADSYTLKALHTANHYHANAKAITVNNTLSSKILSQQQLPQTPTQAHHHHHHQQQQQQHSPSNSKNTLSKLQYIVNPMNCVSIQYAQSASVSQSEQHAKQQLSQWLRNQFNPNPAFKINKSDLYLQYKHVAKQNAWNHVLSIPTFFEQLSVTFPQVRIDDSTGCVHGLRQSLPHLQLANTMQTPTSQASPSITTAINTSNVTNGQVFIASQPKLIAPAPTPQQQATLNSPVTIIKKANINGSTASPSASASPSLTNGHSHHPIINGALQSEGVKLNGEATLPTIAKQQIELKKENDEVDESMEESESEEDESSIGSEEELIARAKKQCKTQLEKVAEPEQAYELCNSKTKVKMAVIERVKNEKYVNNSATITNGNHEAEMNGKSQINGAAAANALSTKLASVIENHEVAINGLKRPHSNGSSSSSQDEINPMGVNGTPSKKKPKKINEMTTSSVVNVNLNVNVNGQKPNEIIKVVNVNNITQSSTPPPPPHQAQPSAIATASAQHVNNCINVAQPVQVQQVIIQPQQQQHQHSIIATQINSIEFLCEWNNCKKVFNTAKSVFNHVCTSHLLNSHEIAAYNSSCCQWSGCDSTRRQKWALISHLQEKHCNEQVLRNALLCRQKGLVMHQQASSGGHAVANYSKDAAFIAIKRTQRITIDEFYSMMDHEPVGKAIHLLAALTLRNLSIHSASAKKHLKQYESFLCNLAFDLVDSSSALASCLWHMTHNIKQ